MLSSAMPRSPVVATEKAEKTEKAKKLLAGKKNRAYYQRNAHVTRAYRATTLPDTPPLGGSDRTADASSTPVQSASNMPLHARQTRLVAR